MFKRLWVRYWTWRTTKGEIIHTLVIARIKLLLGGGFTALQQSGVDIASIVTNNEAYQAAIRIVMAWLVFDGTLSEWARRHKADDIGGPDVDGHS